MNWRQSQQMTVVKRGARIKQVMLDYFIHYVNNVTCLLILSVHILVVLHVFHAYVLLYAFNSGLCSMPTFYCAIPAFSIVWISICHSKKYI